MEPANITNSKTLESRLTWISKLDKNYLAHEYFNDSWHPFSFSQISSHLKQAKLSFLTSAFFPDSLDALNFNASQIDFLSGLSDPVLVEECKDLILNRSFRRDIWVKGSIKRAHQKELKNF